MRWIDNFFDSIYYFVIVYILKDCFLNLINYIIYRPRMTKIVACPIRSPSTLMLRVWCPKPWGIPPADPPTGRGHPQATSTIIITMVTTAIGVHPRRPRVAVVKWLMCLIILASMWIRPWWTQICDPLIVSIQLFVPNDNRFFSER